MNPQIQNAAGDWIEAPCKESADQMLAESLCTFTRPGLDNYQSLNARVSASNDVGTSDNTEAQKEAVLFAPSSFEESDVWMSGYEGMT